MKETLGFVFLALLFIAVTQPKAIGHWWHEVQSGFVQPPTTQP